MADLSDLWGEIFTTAEAAAGAATTPKAILRYSSEFRADLASKSRGQGRAREFATLDILHLALLHSMVLLTRDAPWVADAFNRLLFPRLPTPEFNDFLTRFEAQPLTEAELEAKRDGYRAEYAADMRAAPPIYWERDAANPWFLFAAAEDIENATPRVFTWRMGDPPPPTLWTGYVINATRVLSAIDDRIATLVEGRDE